MYTALDIAKLVLTMSANRKVPVTNLKLQLILYQLYVDFYRQTSKILFDDKFVTSIYGFKVEEVYYEFNIYGGHPIETDFNNEIKYSDYPAIVYHKINELLDLSVKELVNLTQNSPCWKTYASETVENGKKFTEREVSPADIIFYEHIKDTEFSHLKSAIWNHLKTGAAIEPQIGIKILRVLGQVEMQQCMMQNV